MMMLMIMMVTVVEELHAERKLSLESLNLNAFLLEEREEVFQVVRLVMGPDVQSKLRR